MALPSRCLALCGQQTGPRPLPHRRAEMRAQHNIMRGLFSWTGTTGVLQEGLTFELSLKGLRAAFHLRKGREEKSG